MSLVRSLPVPLLLIVACSHAQPPPPVPAQAMAEPAPPPPPQPAAAPAPPPQIISASVYFDFDSAELVPAALAGLQEYYDLARQRPDQGIRIEGNCDERGSREYNLALGQRRADAAKKYLTDLGVPATGISTISYGKERPRVAGHDEAAWRENRRDDLVPFSGPSSDAVSQASK